MQNQKLENSLNLALTATPEERARSESLEVGFDVQSRRWDLIVKYSGDLLEYPLPEDIPVVRLLNEYAIISAREDQIEALAALPQVEYIEKPKRLYFTVNRAKAVSCINSVRGEDSVLGVGLSGSGIIIGCVDSGIDYAHPDFCHADGSTRMISLWDQGAPGNPPPGYQIGSEYGPDQINEALQQQTLSARYTVVPSRDISGHGTSVLGVAAGNGRASGGANIGVAPDSDLVVVRLGLSQPDGFPRTTELMQAIDYIVRLGVRLRRPVAINISFGNNYGGHDGRSLLEQYIDGVANLGRTTICVGTGNEGNTGVHTGGILAAGESVSIYLGVGGFETGLTLQLWKQYSDDISISLIDPEGTLVGPIPVRPGPQRYLVRSTRVLIYYGEPSPFSLSQEILIELIPEQNFIEGGVWTIRLSGGSLISGLYDIWLSGRMAITQQTTGFYSFSPVTTLTIPSTAERVISVGAYNSLSQNFAEFSGRGYTRLFNQVKPDLVAPGVDVMTTATGGGYRVLSGTSIATPFVTGAAALMMEWGIVRGNDPYLYGEKLKAYLRRGTRKFVGETYPNSRLGFGALCLRDSFPAAARDGTIF